MAFLPYSPPTWKIVADGVEDVLRLDLAPDGVTVTGTVFGNPISGIWNETSGKLTFTRTAGRNQIYSGYIFPRLPVRVDGHFFLAGTFEDALGTFGWFAEVYYIL